MIRKTLTVALVSSLLATGAAFADWSVSVHSNSTYVTDGDSTILVGTATSEREHNQNQRDAKKLARKMNKALK